MSLERDEYGEIKLTRKERAAIHALERLAPKWPETLWLFATGNGLCVMRCGEEGQHAVLDRNRPENSAGTVDQAYIVADINIPCDGGDW